MSRASNNQERTYFLPSSRVSEEEFDRLNEQHAQLKELVDNRLTLAPIPDTLQDVLDLGCGTAIWAQEFAKAYPNSHVVGADLAPPTFAEGALPSNISFITLSADDEWGFNQKFDFIHIRLLTLGMKNWPALFKQCYLALKPGGWLQTIDPELLPRCGNGKDVEKTSLHQTMIVFRHGMEAVGLDPYACDHHEDYLKSAGFNYTRKFTHRSHVGSWEETVAAEKNRGSFRNYLEGIAASRKLISHNAPEYVKEDEEKVWTKTLEEVAKTDTEYNFYHN